MTRFPNAPMPDNFDALWAAYASGEPHRIATEESKYEEQCLDDAKRRPRA